MSVGDVPVVLVVNGIWLIGQAQAAQARVAAERRKVPAGASVVGPIPRRHPGREPVLLAWAGVSAGSAL